VAPAFSALVGYAGRGRALRPRVCRPNLSRTAASSKDQDLELARPGRGITKTAPVSEFALSRHPWPLGLDRHAFVRVLGNTSARTPVHDFQFRHMLVARQSHQQSRGGKTASSESQERG
jgi:hypothetical protein